MPTHIQLATDLLRNAAKFFKDVGMQNPDLADQMSTNAAAFDRVALLLETDPTGVFVESEDTPE
jgi:hypothetical protein